LNPANRLFLSQVKEQSKNGNVAALPPASIDPYRMRLEKMEISPPF